MHDLEKLIDAALSEDIGDEDITTVSTVPENAYCHARLIAKQDGVLSGIDAFRTTFLLMEADLSEWEAKRDGTHFSRGDLIASFVGRTRAVLTAERTAMNLVQQLSGVATLTARFMKAVEGLPCRICDTRKTMPAMRRLQKKAVVDGGGANHRHTLFSGVLIKENHIAAAGGIAAAVRRVRAHAPHLFKIEVEVTNLDEFREALEAGAEVIMLDNMSLEDMTEAVRLRASRPVLLEASGNAALDNVRRLAETGVDFISVGALTHSAPAADLSLLVDPV